MVFAFPFPQFCPTKLTAVPCSVGHRMKRPPTALHEHPPSLSPHVFCLNRYVPLTSWIVLKHGGKFSFNLIRRFHYLKHMTFHLNMFKYLHCYFTFKLLAELQVLEKDYLEDINCSRKVLNGLYPSGNSVMQCIQLKSQ